MTTQSDDVTVIAIGTDPNESEGTVRSYRDNEGLSYRISVARPDIVRTYKIHLPVLQKWAWTRTELSKCALSMARQGADWWEGVFNTLTQ